MKMGSNRIVLVEHSHSPGDDRANTHLSAQGFDIERRYPFDGDVLGAQTIAHMLGADVRPPEVKYHEFGYYPLFTTEAGGEFIPDGLVVTQAHFHGFLDSLFGAAEIATKRKIAS